MDGSPKSFDGVFINTDEKHAKDQQLHQLLCTAQVARKKAELNSEIISAVSRLYDSIYQIDLTKFGKKSPTSKRSESGGMNCL